MTQEFPRLLFAAAGSGSGKTTVTCAVLKALLDRGLRVAAFKTGPDYIDPMFHRRALGTPSCNLDLFLCGEAGVRRLFAENSAGADLSIIEGAMGLYDGLRGVSDQGSANHLARVLDAPTILVVDVKGMGLSAAAVVSGFLHFRENRICGVLLNRCSKGMYPVYRQAIEELGVPVLGYLPVLPGASLESRHLGLVTAEEVEGLREKLELLGEAARETIDLAGLVQVARAANFLDFSDNFCKNIQIVKENPVIAVARDRAFCFYYEENLRLLERMGAVLREFSPLSDGSLPEADGLWLGGGYPEEYAEALSANAAMRESVREAVAGGLPTIAECGGFLYLLEELTDRAGRTWPMAGVLPGESHMTGKLIHFGYAYLEAKEENLLCGPGERLAVHEFHYSQSNSDGTGFTAVKGERRRDCGYGSPTLYAGYPHLHFYGKPEAAEKFVRSCGAYQTRRRKEQAT